MNWLESISVEFARTEDMDKIIELCNDIKVPRSAELTVFSMNLSNEVRCHIEWNSESFPEEDKSPLGKKLSQALSDYGLARHTLWLEVDQSFSTADPDLGAAGGNTPENTMYGKKRLCA